MARALRALLATRPGPESDAVLAGGIKTLLTAGAGDQARQQFGVLVDRHQRRGLRIAYHYLRDVAEADEAVQDAFVRAYVHLQSYREDLSFQTWFTRILVNACLDRVKARGRRDRWTVRLLDANAHDRATATAFPVSGPSPEQTLLAAERAARLSAAVTRLPGRQRTVVVLSHFEGCTPREVASLTGLRESTVRVHLFRALRNLRKMLGTRDEGEIGVKAEQHARA